MHTHNDSGCSVPAFVAKLWRLVEDPSTNNLICWNKDGLSFIIQNQSKFARELLPLNYKHNNMASFIRQLNMYGFHKIASIENGGLKFDRDEIEFSHPCFKRGCAYLLEHIKRKIANTKLIDEKSTMKPEAVNKVFSEVKALRGRQESLDSRFNIIKQENEALWSEIATLRQKHMKQQQIVNKLIQFLVTMVQPSRNMSGVKRNFQLMINDSPKNVNKLRKANETVSGPIIHELKEELLDGVTETDPDFISMSPTMSPASGPPSNHFDVGSPLAQIEMFNEASNIQFDPSNETAEDELMHSTNADNYSVQQDDTPVYYHVTEVPEESEDDQYSKNEFNGIENLNELYKSEIQTQQQEKNQKMLKKLQKHQQRQEQKELIQSNRQQQQSLYKKNHSTKKRLLKRPAFNDPLSSQNKITKPNPNPSPSQNDLQTIDPLIFLETSYTEPSTDTGPVTVSDLKPTKESTKIANSNEQSTAEQSYNDFLSNDYVASFFDEAAILDDISLPNANYNEKIDFDKMRSPSTSVPSPTTSNQSIQLNNLQYDSNSRNNLTLAKFNNGLKNDGNDDIMRLSTAEDVNDHLGGMQDDLENLKTMLRGDGYTLDANTLLNLFGDSDVLNPYGDIQLQNENYSAGENAKTGSELMTYQPSMNVDLFDMLDIDEQNPNTKLDDNKKNTPPKYYVLNTPSHE